MTMVVSSHAELRARVAALARIARAPSPVVSVYLDTRWADEHQRERVRVFLAEEIKKTREAGASAHLGADLDWIAQQGEAIVGQARDPDAWGVVLFACGLLGLREVLPVHAPVWDLFVIAEAPFVRRLAEVLDDMPSTLVVFVDAESARLIQLRADGVGPEVRLESVVMRSERHRPRLPSPLRRGGQRGGSSRDLMKP